MANTPKPGLATVIATGGTAVTIIPAGAKGGMIANPYYAADQGIAASEMLYINPVGDAVVGGTGATFAIGPGGSFMIPPDSTLPVTAVAATSGHKFSCIYW